MCQHCTTTGSQPADTFAELSHTVQHLLQHPACTDAQRTEAQRYLCAGSRRCGLLAYRDTLLDNCAAWEDSQLAAEGLVVGHAAL